MKVAILHVFVKPIKIRLILDFLTTTRSGGQENIWSIFLMHAEKSVIWTCHTYLVFIFNNSSRSDIFIANKKYRVYSDHLAQRKEQKYFPIELLVFVNASTLSTPACCVLTLINFPERKRQEFSFCLSVVPQHLAHRLECALFEPNWSIPLFSFITPQFTSTCWHIKPQKREFTFFWHFQQSFQQIWF